MYSKVEISNIVVRGVEVKKSEIRLKSENLHPCGSSGKGRGWDWVGGWVGEGGGCCCRNLDLDGQRVE